jgi:hypothetical protein
MTIQLESPFDQVKNFRAEVIQAGSSLLKLEFVEPGLNAL